MLLGQTSDAAQSPLSRHSQVVGAVVSRAHVSPKYTCPPPVPLSPPTPPEITKYWPTTPAACPSLARGVGPAVFTCTQRSITYHSMNTSSSALRYGTTGERSQAMKSKCHKHEWRDRVQLCVPIPRCHSRPALLHAPTSRRAWWCRTGTAALSDPRRSSRRTARSASRRRTGSAWPRALLPAI